MSQRRMFSPDIVCSEEFLSMPVSSRALYYHLGMTADDDGFIQPSMAMRVCGSTDDDLKVLLLKRFLLPFDGGVVVIKHWLIHNMIRHDRYKPTRFQEQKHKLFMKENRSYTDRKPENPLVILPPTVWQPNGNQMATQVRLGKVRLDNTITEAEASEKDFEIEPEEDYKRNGFKRKPVDQNAKVIMEWAEKRTGNRFPQPIKQMSHISRMLKTGYTAAQIREEWEYLEKDKFWGTKGLDFGIVLSQIAKIHD